MAHPDMNVGPGELYVSRQTVDLYSIFLRAVRVAQNDISVSDVWTTALTEAYRATGGTGTGAQLMYEILQNITEFAISGTTKTTKKLDGTTTAKTYTLDDADNPTSITETT